MQYSVSEWKSAQDQHRRRAQDRLDRYRFPGANHPIYDFLFNYYPVRPIHMLRWHPGIGNSLEADDSNIPEHAHWRFYQHSSAGVELDVENFLQARGDTAVYILNLLRRSESNPARFDCFGLHEWAMVYRSDNVRHDLPLRLGAKGTNDVVDSHSIKCSHYDAFRFFTPPARSLNFTVLNRESQPECDQAGCVHVTMDLFKWAWKLGPLVDGELFLDTFDLAVAARELDMEASPYDCREFGLGVVAIETAAGKAEYVDRQRELAQRAYPLRTRLINTVCQALDARMVKHGPPLYL